MDEEFLLGNGKYWFTIKFPMYQYTNTTRPVEPSGDDADSVVGTSISYTITFKGNTVVDIYPRMEGWERRGAGTRDVIRIFKRERYKRNNAPVKNTIRMGFRYFNPIAGSIYSGFSISGRVADPMIPRKTGIRAIDMYNMAEK